jgi:hypothetical protein
MSKIRKEVRKDYDLCWTTFKSELTDKMFG